MKTVIVELKNIKALKLMEDLEVLDLIRIIKNRVSGSETKLSERLAGSISQRQADKMQEELDQMRGEWERNI